MNNLQKIFLINQQITTIGNTGNVTKIRVNKEYIPFCEQGSKKTEEFEW